MQLIDNISCAPYGYNPSNKIPQEKPDAEPNKEDIVNDEEEMVLGAMLSVIKKKKGLGIIHAIRPVGMGSMFLFWIFDFLYLRENK